MFSAGKISLDVLTRDDAEQIRQWRNRSLESLRTPYPLTSDQQQQWYDAVVNNREATARWWAIRNQDGLVGYTGVQHIDWINSHGEVSLLLGPDARQQGHGTTSVQLVLREAFESLNLNMVWGEAYPTSIRFWQKIVGLWFGDKAPLTERLYRYGRYHDTMYFSITRKQYNRALQDIRESMERDE